jgi:hypothetical protein
MAQRRGSAAHGGRVGRNCEESGVDTPNGSKSKRKLLPKINPFLLHDIDLQLHALGVPVAALTGWSASADQIALLRDRGVRFVTLLLDGDDTGRRGRERVLPDLAASFFVSAPLLADGQKPDTLCEAELRELVALP